MRLHRLSFGKFGAFLSLCVLLAVVGGIIIGSPSTFAAGSDTTTIQASSDDDSHEVALVSAQQLGVFRTVQFVDVLDAVSPLVAQADLSAISARGPPQA